MLYPRPSGRFSLLLALPLLLACDRGEHVPVVTGDSAGVAVMVSNQPAWGPDEGWRLADAPALRIGGVAGQRYHELTNAVDARVLADGSVLVTHCSNPPEVRLFDASGGFVRAWGGEGSADGRCRFILRSWVAEPDTLIIYDPTLSRLNYFRMSGPLARVVHLPAGPDSLLWLDRFADGTLLGRPNRPLPTEEGRSRAHFLYSRLDPRTLAITPTTDALGAEYMVAAVNGRTSAEQVLFAPFTVAAVRGQNILLSDTRDFSIEERSADGTLLRRFSRAWDPVSVDRRFIRDYRDRRLAGAGAQIRQVRQELERALFADHLPAHEPTLLIDGTDHLWVLHMAGARGEDRIWSVFAPDGRWLGEVATPAALTVTQIGADHLVGVWRDGGAGQTVRVYPLLKPT
jgi:hypothetical protein